MNTGRPLSPVAPFGLPASSTSPTRASARDGACPALVFDYIDGGCRGRSDGGARTAPRLRGRDVPAAAMRAGAGVRPDDDGAGHGASRCRFCWRPWATSGSFYPMGDVHAARAAHAAGTGFILSTFSGTRIEDVRAASAGPLVVPAVCAGRARGRRSHDRPGQGRRLHGARGHHRHAGRRVCASATIRRGDPSDPGRATCWRACRYLWQFVGAAAVGGWTTWRTARPGVPQRRVCPASVRCRAATSARCWSRRWSRGHDLRWMRDAWQGPMVVKGVHTADDARYAIGRGRGRRRGVQPRRPSARRCARQPASPAGSRGGRRTVASRC